VVTGGELGEIGDGDERVHLSYDHRVMYGIAELLYCALETNITLYVNYTGIKIENLVKFKKQECSKART